MILNRLVDQHLFLTTFFGKSVLLIPNIETRRWTTLDWVRNFENGMNWSNVFYRVRESNLDKLCRLHEWSPDIFILGKLKSS